MAITENGNSVYTPLPLRKSMDGPYINPASISSQSLDQENYSPGPSSAPPFDIDDRIPTQSNIADVANNESISPLDPRRFTPTLHASLVSEILSLRRDLETKGKIIDNLELSLDQAKLEGETLQKSLAGNLKENRSLTRQLQMVEGGSLNALTELTKERDDAWENISDFRKRLEESQKRAKSHEILTERTQKLWDIDRQKWDEERRKLETKVHITEGRLKVVLREIEASHGQNQPQGDPSNESTISIPMTKKDDIGNTPSVVKLGRKNSNASVNTCDGDLNSVRHSAMSFMNGTTPEISNLADELALDEDEEEAETHEEMHNDVDILGQYISEGGRPLSAQSRLKGDKARKVISLSLERTDSPVPNGVGEATHVSSMSDEIQNGDYQVPQTAPIRYRSVGIQFTPPPSPRLTDDIRGSFIATQQSVSTPPNSADVPIPLVELKGSVSLRARETADKGVGTIPVTTSSTPCQTDNDLPSTPQISGANRSGTVSVSTQTEEQVSKQIELPQFHIPMITIEPPLSNAPTPRNSVVLPPQTKNASSQTLMQSQVEMYSSAMQTEEIRVDKRAVNPKFNLLPSAMPDRPNELCDDAKNPQFTIPTSSGAFLERLRISSPKDIPLHSDTSQAYPGNNDNGPLTGSMSPEIRRPFRSSSLFAGFEQASDDDEQPLSNDVFSDDDISSRQIGSYSSRLGKAISKPSSSILDDSPMEMHEDELSSSLSGGHQATNNKVQDSAGRGNASTKRQARSTKFGSSKQPDIRRAAMISSSAAAHQALIPRSTSAPSINNGSVQPPFPVPTRLSSRKVPGNTSERAQSPTPFGNGSISEDMWRDLPLRKIRSAAVVSKVHSEDQHVNYSPTTLSVSSGGAESPLYPPMPFDEITMPHGKLNGQRHPRNLSSSRENHHYRKESTATSVQQTSVVDAIAQTMVGEWMWKYVRRRKSFGVPEPNSRDGWEVGKSTEETSANISGTGVRHKRWVWLAPYERAVMWSSKQPSSGPALLGKSGRKLTIQSVLDVKDENPLPRGTSSQDYFNSHSTANLNSLTTPPPVPQLEHTQRPPTAALRRNPIRDSIRVAKGKNRPVRSNRSVTAHAAATPGNSFPDISTLDSNTEPAEPPNVPRFSSHSRKRSNTAPKPLQIPPRNLPNQVGAPSVYSTTTAGSSDLYSPTSVAPSGFQSGQSSLSRRTSEASGIGAGGYNFFDAVGTVRMEAFVGRSEVVRQRGNRHAQQGTRKRDYWPRSPDIDFRGPENCDGVSFRNYDPFKGF